jgi:transposase
MASAVNRKLTDNLSDEEQDLSARLHQIEWGCGAWSVEVRYELLHAIANYRTSKYRLGEALVNYRAVYTQHEQGWTAAVDEIAKAVGVNQRTVFRWIAQYEKVAGLQAEVITAVENAGLDPASNTKTMAKVIEMCPIEPSEEEAAETVEQAKEAVKADRRETSRAARKGNADDRVKQAFCCIENLYANVKPAEREAELEKLFEMVRDHFSIGSAS